MKHIPNDHVNTIIRTYSLAYGEINDRIKSLIANQTAENEIAIKELRRVKYRIGHNINI